MLLFSPDGHSAYSVPCRSASFPKQSVKLAFSLPALAAAPVATHFSLPSSTQTCHEVWQLLDLLVLQPSGTLVLHRGSYALAAVTIQLPKGIATQLAEASAAGQQQQREVRRPSLGAAAAGASLLAGPMRGPVSTAGSLGCLSMSEASDGEGAESDDMMMSPSECWRALICAAHSISAHVPEHLTCRMGSVPTVW